MIRQASRLSKIKIRKEDKHTITALPYEAYELHKVSSDYIGLYACTLAYLRDTRPPLIQHRENSTLSAAIEFRGSDPKVWAG